MVHCCACLNSQYSPVTRCKIFARGKISPLFLTAKFSPRNSPLPKSPPPCTIVPLSSCAAALLLLCCHRSAHAPPEPGEPQLLQPGTVSDSCDMSLASLSNSSSALLADSSLSDTSLQRDPPTHIVITRMLSRASASLRSKLQALLDRITGTAMGEDERKSIICGAGRGGNSGKITFEPHLLGLSKVFWMLIPFVPSWSPLTRMTRAGHCTEPFTPNTHCRTGRLYDNSLSPSEGISFWLCRTV